MPGCGNATLFGTPAGLRQRLCDIVEAQEEVA